MSKPLAIDLYCGLGGWTDGLLAEGYDVLGFDIERHEYWLPEEVPESDDGQKGTRPVAKRGWTQGCAVSLGIEGSAARPRTRLVRYPAQLVVQDVLTLHGSQFRNVDLIVASPPCQEYSYMAMPWSKAKALAADYRSGKRDVKQLTALFDACFRIQHEACEASGRHIPLVVENVRGAIPWVGRSRWNWGAYHFWGDVPALMPPITRSSQKVPGFRFDGSGRSFQTASVEAHVKLGGSWFHGYRAGQGPRNHGSKSKKRKQASALIAKIPFEVSTWFAKCFKPI